MKPEDENESRIRHIRLPVTEHTGEKGLAFPGEKKKKTLYEIVSQFNFP